jgi:hypothetical protein
VILLERKLEILLYEHYNLVEILERAGIVMLGVRDSAREEWRLFPHLQEDKLLKLVLWEPLLAVLLPHH